MRKSSFQIKRWSRFKLRCFTIQMAGNDKSREMLAGNSDISFVFGIIHRWFPFVDFWVPKQIIIINRSCCSANTVKHVHVSASCVSHVCICGMNTLWHDWAVNLGHFNDWRRLACHLISHGDQGIVVTAVKRAASPTMVTGAEHSHGLKKKMPRNGEGNGHDRVSLYEVWWDVA